MGRSHSVVARAAVLAGVVLATAACSDLDLPNPLAGVTGSNATYFVPQPTRTTVVVARFDDPADSLVPWAMVGEGFTRALGERLLGEPRFDVRRDDGAHLKMQSASGGSASLREAFPGVDYIIAGRIVELHHTAERAGQQRDTRPSSGENEAVARVEFRIIDLRTGSDALAETFVGNAPAGSKLLSERYRGVAFGSSTFWRTPLGEAVDEVIDQVVAQLREIAPPQVAEVSVIRVQNGRELFLNGGREHGIETGQRYFVCARDLSTGGLRIVRDEVLGTQLKAQIRSTDARTCTAWLMGEAPPTVNLGDAVLTRELPAYVGHVAGNGNP